MSSLLKHISIQLKKLRTDKGWSLDQTSKETGISKAMLGQIEREESNPTVQTLWKIALGFNTSLSTFLPVERKNEAILHHQDEMVSIKTIQPFNIDLGYEILYIKLKAKSIHHSCAHAKNVIEDILPLTGTVTIKTNNQTFTAKVGETIRFNADQAHWYVNTENTDLEFYNIIHYS